MKALRKAIRKLSNGKQAKAWQLYEFWSGFSASELPHLKDWLVYSASPQPRSPWEQACSELRTSLWNDPEQSLAKVLSGLEVARGKLVFSTAQELNFYLRALAGSVASVSMRELFPLEMAQMRTNSPSKLIEQIGAELWWWQLLQEPVRQDRLWVPLCDVHSHFMNVEDLIERNAPENYLLRLSDFELRILLHSLEASESALRRVGGALEQAGGELLEEVSKEIKLALRERWLIGSPFQAAKQGFSIRSLIALTPRKDQQETGH